MTTCPSCGHQNIEGVDSCESCSESLTDLHLHEPATDVERSLLDDRISVLEPKSPITVSSNTPVRDVVVMLAERGIGSVLIVDEGKLVGIFSERDALLKLNTEANELGEKPISEFMTADPETLAANVKVAFAVQRMDLGGFRHVPIMAESGELDGVISVRDILSYLTERSNG